MRFSDKGLPDWEFSLEEISYGRWQADGVHKDGRSVSREGASDTQLIAEIVEDARALPERRNA